MKRIRSRVGQLGLVGILLGSAAPLGAEELRPALSAPLILNMLALPMEKPGAQFRDSLREVPTARGAGEWEVLPDGSARLAHSPLYVIIKNPCPDGTLHTPVALPGRNRR